MGVKDSYAGVLRIGILTNNIGETICGVKQLGFQVTLQTYMGN